MVMDPTNDTASARSTADNDLVIVANRLPVHRVDGEWATSPGGLVRAMLGVLRDRHGAWIGWTGDVTDADGDADRGGGTPAMDDSGDEPPSDDHSSGSDSLHELDNVELVAVPLTEHEFLHHYERISNGALWPLFHDAIRDSNFDPESWAVYRDVNQRFADRAAEHAAPGATVWIHDYQLLLVPEMLRSIRPDVKIGFFLHIPFPPQELFMRMPWREELLAGVLGADLIGFQRSVGAANFVGLTQRLLDAHVDADDPGTVRLADGRVIHVGTFPISIDVAEIDQLADHDDVAAKAVELRHALGDPTTVFLGVDRLDYTKGIDLRLTSFGALLRDRAAGDDSAAGSAGPDPVLVQIAVPGREGVESYLDERRVVEQLVGDVNGEHAAIGRPAVHYIRRGLSLDELIPLYLAADVMLVTPRRDGMNLVAKEFVAARRDDTGILILSEFAGAADELTEAILVNPHDPDAIMHAMQLALTMSADDIAERMAGMRKVVADNDVHDWARSFLRHLAGIRQDDRIGSATNDRSGDPPTTPSGRQEDRKSVV